jgi:hypothetical protein
VRPVFVRSWLLIGLAVLWSGVAVAVLLRYHIPEPLGMTSITTNGHTYTGDPPALTLLQRDPVSFVTIAVTLGAGLFVGLIDLILRFNRSTARVGVGAIVAGSLVLLVSLFGLLPGLLGVGVVGIFLIASGLPQRRRIAD